MLIGIVEDDEYKGRAIQRMVLDLTTGADVRWVRTLVDAADLLLEEPAAVVTDWSFPEVAGEPPVTGVGRVVVDACAGGGIPVLVVSGSDPPPAYSKGVDWVVSTGDVRGRIRALLERAGVITTGAP